MKCQTKQQKLINLTRNLQRSRTAAEALFIGAQKIEMFTVTFALYVDPLLVYSFRFVFILVPTMRRCCPISTVFIDLCWPRCRIFAQATALCVKWFESWLSSQHNAAHMTHSRACSDMAAGRPFISRFICAIKQQQKPFNCWLLGELFLLTEIRCCNERNKKQ